MTLAQFEQAKRILSERSGYIKNRDWCNSILKYFEHVSYVFNVSTIEIDDRICGLSELPVRRELVKEMISKYRDVLEADIEKLSKEFENL